VTHYSGDMPLFSDTEGPAPDWAAEASVTDMLTMWADTVRRGHVVYLTGPGMRT
jgi:NADPH-dependent ferric siderophore reductase